MFQVKYKNCLSPYLILVEGLSANVQRLRDYVDAVNCITLPSFQKDSLPQGLSKTLASEAREHVLKYWGLQNFKSDNSDLLLCVEYEFYIWFDNWGNFRH